MNLLLSDSSKLEISDLAESIDGRIDCSDAEVVIVTAHLSISFLQPERYSRLVTCEFKFSPEVGFLFVEILKAFAADDNSVSPPNFLTSTDKQELQANTYFVSQVASFCRKHWVELTTFPPYWYEKAVRISYEGAVADFPELADEDFRNKMDLLDVWKNAS